MPQRELASASGALAKPVAAGSWENVCVQSLANPLSEADIETRQRECARLGETQWDPARLIEAVWGLDTLSDIGLLVNSSSGRPS
jgi:hypothetical protein